LHYRRAPTLAAYAHRLMAQLAANASGTLELQKGKRVVELKPAGIDKGTAIGEYLGEPPFRGRRPVFIGDDATDEHGFAEVNRGGGVSIRVGPGASCARFRLADVAAVRGWLTGALTEKT
jgi:trehalose 6-phosphate phosphatase